MISRRTLMATLTALVFALATLIHPPGKAYACSCMIPPPAEQARDQATAVFIGKVRSIIRQTESSQVEVVLDLSESWKGPNAPTLSIFTSASSASCGYDFVEGESYLVYADAQDERLSVSLCSRTAPQASASADIAALGVGRPAPQVMHDVLTPQPPVALLIGLAALAIAGASAFVFLRRRGRAA